MKSTALTQRTKTDLILAASLLAWLAVPLAGQSSSRMWAAQTGPDEVTVVWDSIPGAVEYRIYLGAPTDSGEEFERPPASVLSASGRRAAFTGIQRLSNGIYLVAVDRNGRLLQRTQFNPVAATTNSPRVAPPTEVTAEATGATEVTVSWNAVPGATAYFIGRAVAGSGSRAICDLCSTETPYVDRAAVAGLAHSYTISAIFPNGISRRITSSRVTPGGTPLATTPGQQMPTTTATTTTLPATFPTTTPSTTTQPTTTPPAGPKGPSGLSAPTPTAPEPPSGVTATTQGLNYADVRWTSSPTADVRAYDVHGSVNGGAFSFLANLSASSGVSDNGLRDQSFTGFLASGPARASYYVVAVSGNGMRSERSNTTPEVLIQPPICKLDYQRADNMWAAFGRPDGPLGTEKISLPPAQNKVFNTDWTYEKKRNDGSNYYGSHLRIATNVGSNVGSNTIRLQLRSVTLTGLEVFLRTGTDTFWIRMAPGRAEQFQADLMEMACGE